MAFIIGDAQGGDYIVGRPPYYDGRKAKRICRTCNAGPEQVDSTRPGMCRRIIQADVEKMMEENKVEELKKLYQSTCPNAFFDLDYGNSPFGIFTAACPTEGLHQMEKGLILDCLSELFKNQMSSAMLAELDAIVISWYSLPNQKFTNGSMEVYPRLMFRDGITTLTDTTANTVVGFMFAVVLASLTRDGRELFSEMQDDAYLNMIYTFESLLCFWAWLKKDKYWKIESSQASLDRVEHAICILMGKVKTLWPRSSGCEWKKPKFHETYHNALNIYLFGKPSNWHSGPAEHNHICHVKKVANTTQKRKMEFDWQLGNRLVEKFIIEKAFAKLNQVKTKLGHATLSDIGTIYSNISDTQKKHTSGRYKLFIQELPDGQIDVSYKWMTSRKQYYQLPRLLIETIVKERFSHLSRSLRRKGKMIVGFTEYHRNNSIFRAHPMFRNDKPWYDYVMLAWEEVVTVSTPLDDATDSDDSSQASVSVLQNAVELENLKNTKQVKLVPAQILGFIENENMDLEAIVHSCHEGSRKLSVLTNRWRLEYIDDHKKNMEKENFENNDSDDMFEEDDLELPQYKISDDNTSSKPLLRFVSVDIIEKHCLLLPIHSKSKYLMHVIDFDKWPCRFLDE